MRRALAALAALASLTGCASEGTAGGGRIVGETLTVYSLLPDTPVARDIIDGEKLALAQAGGQAGSFKVNFAVDHLAQDDTEKVADTIREAIHDLQIVAAISDLDSETARTTIPLLNAGGILHLSPGATYPGFVAAFPGAAEDEPARWQPSPKRTFASLAPSDLAQAQAIAEAAEPPVLIEAEPDDVLGAELRRRLRGKLTDDGLLARTAVYAGSDVENARGVLEPLRREAPRARIVVPESLLRAGVELPSGVRAMTSAPAPTIGDAFQQRFGRCATRYAQLGYDAMKSVLDAIETAGERANDRRVLADTWLAANKDRSQAFELVADAGCPAG